MINSIYTAATAINAAATLQAVSSHNIANSRTSSFRANLATLVELNHGGVRLNPLRQYNGFGYLENTNNPTDIAIFGKNNYDALNNIYSEYYNRFSVDDFGNFRGPKGELLFTGAGGNVRVDPEGNIYNNDELLGRVTPADQIEEPTGYSILSGFMMMSNVDIADEMVNNILNERFLQFNALTVKTSDEMLGTVINLKG